MKGLTIHYHRNESEVFWDSNNGSSHCQILLSAHQSGRNKLYFFIYRRTLWYTSLYWSKHTAHTLCCFTTVLFFHKSHLMSQEHKGMMLTGLSGKSYKKIQVRQTDYLYWHCYNFLFSGPWDARFTNGKIHNFLVMCPGTSYRSVEEAWAHWTWICAPGLPKFLKYLREATCLDPEL